MDIRIPLQGIDDTFLSGELVIVDASKGLIIFAHGSGSGQASPRNRYVATTLNQNRFATVLVDLLTISEQESDLKYQKLLEKYPSLTLNKFNIRLLASRLETVTTWLLDNIPEVKDLPIGYFGSSTGAAAAIESSAALSNEFHNRIYAIVSRGGRPDLAAAESLKSLKASVMLIIGAKDSKEVLNLNKKAFKELKNAKSKEMIMIPHAGHLFEEEGMIEQVADKTTKWFKRFI